MEGIERAKREGKYKGRKPTARSRVTEVMDLVNQGFTRTAIAKKLNMGNASVYRILKEHRQSHPEKNIPGSRAIKNIAMVEVWLRVENNNKFVRGKNESRRQIENNCFAAFDMVKKDKDGWEYILRVLYTSDRDLDKTVYDLMYDAESIADCRNGFTEMSITEPKTGKSW